MIGNLIRKIFKKKSVKEIYDLDFFKNQNGQLWCVIALLMDRYQIDDIEFSGAEVFKVGTPELAIENRVMDGRGLRLVRVADLRSYFREAMRRTEADPKLGTFVDPDSANYKKIQGEK